MHQYEYCPRTSYIDVLKFYSDIWAYFSSITRLVYHLVYSIITRKHNIVRTLSITKNDVRDQKYTQ